MPSLTNKIAFFALAKTLILSLGAQLKQDYNLREIENFKAENVEMHILKASANRVLSTTVL